MSLYGALFAGVSGLGAQSSAMGAIADNVTNVNTVGYKGTKVNFQTLVTKQVSSTKYSSGGVQSRPRTGVDVQGLLQGTTRATDLGISGNGMFIVSDQAANPSGFGYTRAGSFDIDRDGFLQNVGGQYIQGWPLQNWDGTNTAAQVTKDGNVFMKSYTNGAGETYYMNDNAVDSTNLQPLNLRTIGGTARATSTLAMGVNLPANLGAGNTGKTNSLIFDSLGNSHNLNYTWINEKQNSWHYIVEPPKGSAEISIKDQKGGTYFSAGRIDFRDTGMPADGSKLVFEGTDINYSSSFDPDGVGGADFAAGDDNTMVPVRTIDFSASPAEGDIMKVTLNGSTSFTFEFDTDGVVASGNTGITVTGTAATDASTFAAALQGQMAGALGEGEWAKVVGTDVLVGGPSGLTADMGIVGDLTAAPTGGIVDADITAFAGTLDININPTGKTMSQISSLTAKAMNALLVNSQGVPPSVPGSWAARVEGTTGITFLPDATNDITFDTTDLKDADGKIAVLQSDTATGDAFTISRIGATFGWLNTSDNYGVSFNGDGSPDKFFGRDETSAPDPRGKVHINWVNGALNMDDTGVTSGGSAAITTFLGNYNVRDGLQQLAGSSDSSKVALNYLSQNGNKFGNFAGVTVGEDGIVTALFDNGVTTPIFMIPVATFTNPNGMAAQTGNVFQQTDLSGLPTVREAGTAGAGVIAGGTLESSTVDLGEEFTTMITTQRAYSASAKIITTADEMLDELIRIKR